MTVSTDNGEQLPATESVAVDVGSASCGVSLVPGAGGGSGTCSIGEDDLTAGPYTASATYPGDADIAATAPGSTAFTVNAAPPPPTISGVVFGGSSASPTVTVSGAGFGSQADLGTPTVPYCNTLTGSNYGNNLYLASAPGAIGPWQAGQGPDDCVGLLVSSYSNSRITFTFGSGYPIFGPLANGDTFSMTVLGTTFTGTAVFGPAALFSCNVSGLRLGTNPDCGVGIAAAAVEHRRRWHLRHGPGRPGHHPRLGDQPLRRPRGHLADRRLASAEPGRPDLRRGIERGGEPQERIGIGHQPAPERHRPGPQHPLHLQHQLQSGDLADRPGDRAGRFPPGPSTPSPPS